MNMNSKQTISPEKFRFSTQMAALLAALSE